MICASIGGAVAGGDAALLPRLLLVFPALHLVYGAGVIVGLVKPRFRRGDRSAEEIEIRRVKAFGERLKT